MRLAAMRQPGARVAVFVLFYRRWKGFPPSTGSLTLVGKYALLASPDALLLFQRNMTLARFVAFLAPFSLNAMVN
jgi:hypothetical protein